MGPYDNAAALGGVGIFTVQQQYTALGKYNKHIILLRGSLQSPYKSAFFLSFFFFLALVFFFFFFLPF